jgi:hypothetical protein
MCKNSYQNNGVVVRGEQDTSIIENYGELKNIVKLCYPGQNRVYLFECKWWDIGSMRGIKMDHDFRVVNTSHKWYESRLTRSFLQLKQRKCFT